MSTILWAAFCCGIGLVSGTAALLVFFFTGRAYGRVEQLSNWLEDN